MTMDPLIITCAPVGAEIMPEQTPNLPVTPAQLGETAAKIAQAGASIIHVHCREDDGTNTHAVARFHAAYSAIRLNSDLIVQFSTGGAIGMRPDERAAVLQLRPEMATLTCGSVGIRAIARSMRALRARCWASDAAEPPPPGKGDWCR